MYRPIKNTPNAWDGYMKPFRITDNVYYVGAYQVCTYLVDTKDGLVVIDAGYEKCLYMVIDSIHRLGFDPMDVKYIISTHGHYDHVEANRFLRGMTGAQVIIGEKDAPTIEQYGGADITVKDGDTLTVGEKTFRFIHTPGHTIGCMSPFFEDTLGGKIVTVGTFGGAGANTLTKKSSGYYEGATDDYLRSVDRLLNEKLDVYIANHTWNNDTLGKGIKLLETGINDFADPEKNDWVKFLEFCRERCISTALENEKIT